MSTQALIRPIGAKRWRPWRRPRDPLAYAIEIPGMEDIGMHMDTPLAPIVVRLPDGTEERTVRRALPDEGKEALVDRHGADKFTVWLVVLLSYDNGDASDGRFCALVLARTKSSPTEFQRVGCSHYLPIRSELMERREFSIV